MKIAFVHNRCMNYREEFFRMIDNKYDIDFYFLDNGSSNLKSCFKIKSLYIPKLSDFTLALNLKKMLLKRNYDIFVSTDLGYHITYITYKVAKRKGKKFILWNEQWKEVNHPRRKLTKYLENNIIKNSDAMLAFGSKAKEFLIRRGGDASKIIWAPNAISENMVPKSNINYCSYLPKKYVVLCIARLIPIKGISYLIKAFNIVKGEFNDVQLIIAGSGPEENRLRKLINDLNLKDVILTGREVKLNEKWMLYNRADIFVLPSVYIRSSEAWGLVVNEAAICGKPIITTNMAGVAGEIVRDGESGFIVPEKNEKELAQAILKLLKNDDLRIKMGIKAKNIVLSQYTLEKMFDSFKKAVEMCK